jgi:hypothetical protein
MSIGPYVNWRAGVAGVLGLLAIVSSAALAGDELPIIGKFTQNVACVGDGSMNKDFLVTITPTRIDSSMAVCTISHIKRSDAKFTVQTSCKSGGNDLFTGDVTLTMIDENRIDVEDNDQTFTSVLYRCGK